MGARALPQRRLWDVRVSRRGIGRYHLHRRQRATAYQQSLVRRCVPGLNPLDDNREYYGSGCYNRRRAWNTAGLGVLLPGSHGSGAPAFCLAQHVRHFYISNYFLCTLQGEGVFFSTSSPKLQLCVTRWCRLVAGGAVVWRQRPARFRWAPLLASWPSLSICHPQHRNARLITVILKYLVSRHS